MPRLRNTSTGVIVNVSDERAATLEGFEPAPRSTTKPKAAASKKTAEAEDTK